MLTRQPLGTLPVWTIPGKEGRPPLVPMEGGVPMARMMRVAYFSPLAPQRTETSRYSEDLLPHLCRRVQVDAYTDDRIAATQEVGRIYPLYGYRDFAAQLDRYDQLIFQLGSSPEHVPVYDLFLRFGGVVALHDLNLSGLIEAKTLAQGDGWGYLQELRRHEGLGPFLRTAGGALLHGQWPTPRPARLEMTRLVAQRASGVIVHSATARAHLAARYPEAQLREVPIGIPQPPAIDAQEARQALGLPRDAYVCASVGPLSDAHARALVQVFARLLERCPSSLLVSLGEPPGARSLERLARALGVEGKVRLAGQVDLATLYRYLAAADAGIALGRLERGAAPSDLLRLMSMARPAVVPNCAPYASIPDCCIVKVEPGEAGVPQAAAALWALAGHVPLRLSYGRQAARYVRTAHSLSASARDYADFVEELSTVEAAERLLSERMA